MSAEINRIPTVFVSYSHKDGKWLDRLRVHLKPLERRYRSAIQIWDDSKIKPGEVWLDKIGAAGRRKRMAEIASLRASRNGMRVSKPHNYIDVTFLPDIKFSYSRLRK
jgi:hypothetical protein